MADVVRMKNGQDVVGKVVEETGPMIRVEMKNGAVRIPKIEVEWIVLGTEKEIENGRRAAWHYGEAQTYFQRRRYDQAVVEYKNALDYAPDDANLLNNMGCAYAYLELYSEAIGAFTSALKHKPDNATMTLNLAQSYIKAGEYRRAERHLRKLVAITQTESDAYLLLGVVFYKLGRYTKSIDAYTKALKLDGRESGQAAQVGTKSYEALQLATRLTLGTAPGSRTAEIYNNLGSSFLSLRRFDEARRAYDKALELKPDLLSAKYNREAVDKAEGTIAA